LHQSENKQFEYPTINPLIVGIQYDRQTRRQRITERLRERLNQGMIEEVKGLMQQGLSVEQLEYYGLEYKFIAYYLSDKLTYNQMFDQLNVAIHQFAKRQMTWLRRMERNGRTICWLDGSMPLQEKLNKIDSLYFG
jgi:tRNA dimethylallyltransferase